MSVFKVVRTLVVFKRESTGYRVHMIIKGHTDKDSIISRVECLFCKNEDFRVIYDSFNQYHYDIEVQL